MATEGGDKVEPKKKKLTGPAKLFRLGKSRKGSESRANRRQASGEGGGVSEEGGVFGMQEEVREEAGVCSGVDVQTTRGSCSPDQEEEEEEGSGGTRRTQKGAWRRVFSPAFTCFGRRRRWRPRPESSSSSSTPGCPTEQTGPKAKKRRFPGLALFRHLLPSSRAPAGGAEPRSAAADACETRRPCHTSVGAAAAVAGGGQPGRGPGPGKPERVALENNNDDGDARRLSAAGPDNEVAGHVVERRSDPDYDGVAVEMSVQEPDAATESQLGCFEPASEGDPQWPDPQQQAPPDPPPDPAEDQLPPPSTAHNDLTDAAVATADQLPDDKDKASPSDGAPEEEEALTTLGLSNGLHCVGEAVAMVTNDHPIAARAPPPVGAVLVVPLIRLNSGEEDGVCDWEGGACDWEAAAPVAEAPPPEGGVGVEEDWEVKGGGGGDGDELVLAAQAVVQAALLAAVQQLLREQQNSVDHVLHHDPHHLAPDPY